MDSLASNFTGSLTFTPSAKVNPPGGAGGMPILPMILKLILCFGIDWSFGLGSVYVEVNLSFPFLVSSNAGSTMLLIN